MSKGKHRSKSPKRQAKDAHETDEEMHIFCSDMYSLDFISDAIATVKTDGHVTKLVLEDLILRNDDKTTAAVVDLIVNSFDCAKNKSSKFNSPRTWKSITFVDCVSDLDTYEEHGKTKEKFIDTIKRQMLLKGASTELPLRSELKIELHSMLDAYDMIRLLQAIERDQNVKAMKIPGFRGKGKEIVDAFIDMFDKDEMKLKQNMEIYLRFRKTSVATTNQDGKNPATAVIKEIAQKLEELVFSASCIGSLAFELSERIDSSDKFGRGAPKGMKAHTEVSCFDSAPLEAQRMSLETH